MRETGRAGGALVAAAVAQLENKTHTRLVKRTPAGMATPDRSRKPPATETTPAPSKSTSQQPPKEAYNYRGEPIRDDDTSSSDSDEEYPARKQSSPARQASTDRDSVSVKSSERETTDDPTTTSESETEEGSSDESEDRTQGSVLERTKTGVAAGAANGELDTSTCCDEDFQWIKNEPNAGYKDQKSSPISPAHDTDDERRKIVKSKRTDIPNSKFCTEKPPVPGGGDKVFAGSLDRRRHHPTNRMERDQKSKSTHNLKTTHCSPSRQSGYTDEMQNLITDYCNNRVNESPGTPRSYHHGFTPPRHGDVHRVRAGSYEHFNRRHEHNDPQRYGSNCLLSDPRQECPRDYYRMNDNNPYPDTRNGYYYNSRQDLSSSHNDMCCGGGPHYPQHRGAECYCHPAPYWCPCSEQNRYRNHYGCKNSDGAEDRVRRLESDKDSLQLQVSVLSDQIAAQTDKITDLERLLNEKRTLLANAEELLQREILTRSSLETQKLELMSTVSEARLRQAALERENIELKTVAARPPPLVIANGAVRRTSHSPSPSPSPASNMMQHNARDNPPRTPPATYRRLVSDQSPHTYNSLPRGASLGSAPTTPRSAGVPLDTAVVLRSVGFADKDTIIGTASSPILGKVSTGGKGWGSLFKGGSGGALEDITDGDSLDPFQRGGVRATAAPRLQTTNFTSIRWTTTPIKEWDADISCEWLESMGLECYNADAKKWLVNPAGNKGILATASPHQIEKELNIKNPLHKKKIVLAIQDLMDSSADPLLSPAGRLDMSWALRWLEDAGLPQYREAWAAARADGRVLHRLCHEDLHALKVTSQLHALSIRRGIQVLRENNFSPDTMIRRGTSTDVNGEGETEIEGGHVSRWSSHRVMEWLRAVDLAEYAPNLRGAGVHGGLMYYETRFTGELLATLLNIPPSKTLLRRHLNTRFNQLLGKEIIQEKREAEQTLGYQPLTLTSKVVKKGQFTLKRKKNKNEPEYGDLVCPMADQASGELLSMTKMDISGGEVSAVCRTSDEMSNSTDSPLSQRSDHSRS